LHHSLPWLPDLRSPGSAKANGEKLEAVVSSDDGQRKSKARRVSTDVSASNAASLHVDTPAVTENATTANTTSAATPKHEELEL
jgi:hypothetical protein